MNTVSMKIEASPRPQVRPGLLRCSCDRCGAHVIARSAFRIAGFCENCGSYEITPIAPEPARAGRRRPGQRIAASFI